MIAQNAMKAKIIPFFRKKCAKYLRMEPYFSETYKTVQNRNAIFRLKRYDFKYSNEHEPQYFRVKSSQYLYLINGFSSY